MTLLVVLCLMVEPISAQDGYQRPPEVIAKLIEAPSTPSVSIDSKGEWMLLMERPGYPSIENDSRYKLRQNHHINDLFFLTEHKTTPSSYSAQFL